MTGRDGWNLGRCGSLGRMTLLLLCRDPADGASLRGRLRREGFRVLLAAGGAEVRAILRGLLPDALVLHGPPDWSAGLAATLERQARVRVVRVHGTVEEAAELACTEALRATIADRDPPEAPAN